MNQVNEFSHSDVLSTSNPATQSFFETFKVLKYIRMKKLLFVLFLFTETVLFAQVNTNISLNGEWELSYGLKDKNSPENPDELKDGNFKVISATVPGNVELDLLAAGEIENPEVGNNVYKLRKYEAYQWWYSREFKKPKFDVDDRVEIVFDGLDNFGTIWINNTLIGETENMLISHSFDITDALKPEGSNTIFIRINPAVPEAQKHTVGVFSPRQITGSEQLYVRKAPHMYGWDIMPRLISAGLWRDVSLVIKKPNRFENIYWMTKSVDVSNRTANLLLQWQISSNYPTIDGITMEIFLEKNDKVIYEDSHPIYSFCGKQNINLDDVDFWWPRGSGDAALYDATVRIVDANNNILDEKKKKIGIRTAELIFTDFTTKEDPGEFVFKINGEKIFVRGTNWVPLDALHSRDKTHLGNAIDMVTDLNCNMIRCWGGNVYEDTDFFDLCDEKGIMVWQDFAMACTEYPQDLAFTEQIREEAISVVLKIREHPSLVVWCGNNENDQSTEWVFSNQLIDPGMDIISREILPRIIWEYDPIRVFLPSSPFYSAKYFKENKVRGTLPEVHLWGPRGYYKAPFYTDINAHFVSEIGYHGCPNRASLEKMFEPDYVYPWKENGAWNDQWQTKAVRCLPNCTGQDKRNDLMLKQVDALFGERLEDLDQFIFASQVVQAEAMKFFVEFWRMDKFNKTGIIWWNLRDGWPIISDAIVDYYNSKKLAYYYIKQVQHNACVMIGDAKNGQHPVIAVNDSREEKTGTVTVKDADTGNTVFSAKFDIPVNGKTSVGEIPEVLGKQAMWLIDYTIENEKYTNHYLTGKAPFKLKDYQRWFKKLNINRSEN